MSGYIYLTKYIDSMSVYTYTIHFSQENNQSYLFSMKCNNIYKMRDIIFRNIGLEFKSTENEQHIIQQMVRLVLAYNPKHRFVGGLNNVSNAIHMDMYIPQM